MRIDQRLLRAEAPGGTTVFRLARLIWSLGESFTPNEWEERLGGDTFGPMTCDLVVSLLKAIRNLIPALLLRGGWQQFFSGVLAPT